MRDVQTIIIGIIRRSARMHIFCENHVISEFVYLTDILTSSNKTERLHITNKYLQRYPRYHKVYGVYIRLHAARSTPHFIDTVLSRNELYSYSYVCWDCGRSNLERHKKHFVYCQTFISSKDVFVLKSVRYLLIDFYVL